MASMAFTLQENSLITQRPEHLASALDGETVLLHMTSGLYYGLNPVGARIWDLLQTPQTVGELVGCLLEEYEVDREQCFQDLSKILLDLQQAQLIQVDGQ